MFVSKVLYIKFCFLNLGNGREDKKGRRQITFDFKNGKSSISAKYIGICFIIVKSKSSLSTSVFIFSTISLILQTKLNVFQTKTCRNWTQLFTWTCYFSQVSHALHIFWNCMKIRYQALAKIMQCNFQTFRESSKF